MDVGELMNERSSWLVREMHSGILGCPSPHKSPPDQCCQIGRFSAQLGYFCLRQAGRKYIGRVNTIWAAFVHIWRVFNIVKTALSLF